MAIDSGALTVTTSRRSLSNQPIPSAETGVSANSHGGSPEQSRENWGEAPDDQSVRASAGAKSELGHRQ